MTGVMSRQVGVLKLKDVEHRSGEVVEVGRERPDATYAAKGLAATPKSPTVGADAGEGGRSRHL